MAKQASGQSSPNVAGIADFHESPINDPFKTIVVPEKKTRFEESKPVSPKKKYSFMRDSDIGKIAGTTDRPTRKSALINRNNLNLQQQTPSFSQNPGENDGKTFNSKGSKASDSLYNNKRNTMDEKPMTFHES